MNLDDTSLFAAADPSDALGAVEGAAAQWLEAIKRSRGAVELPSRRGIDRVVFCGMGGSGIAGDIAEAIAAAQASVTVSTVKTYTLPHAVGPNTLVIAASYSGNTEETLACFDEAVRRKARVVVITTGGALAERARTHGVPMFVVPSGLQPRAALPSMLVPTMVALEELGILGDVGVELAEVQGILAGHIAALGRNVPAAENEAKRIAMELRGRVPLIWGQAGPLAVAAYRWRCQIEENAKQFAASQVFPELNHNELVGFEPGAPGIGSLAIVALRGSYEHERVTRRIQITLDQIRPQVASVIEASSAGETVLARVMSACILGDFVSVYLAYLRGVDPTPVPVIERLKADLAR